MDNLRSIFSSFRLPTIPRFNTNPPCEITVEFFFLCGHTVTSRRCRNEQRIWRDGAYFDPAMACDEFCRTRSLPYMIHMNLPCMWCRYPGGVQVTSSVRSDPGLDVIRPMEMQRRREFYLQSRRSQITEAQRAEIYRGRSKEASWETCKRLEHEWADSIGMGWHNRTYFVGGTTDTRFYIPVDQSSFPGTEDEVCPYCLESLWGGVNQIRFPCHITHRYHMGCVDGWLREHKSCPTCRYRYRLEAYHDWELEYDNRACSRFLARAATTPVENWIGTIIEAVEEEDNDEEEEANVQAELVFPLQDMPVAVCTSDDYTSHDTLSRNTESLPVRDLSLRKPWQGSDDLVLRRSRAFGPYWLGTIGGCCHN